jgi:hypothetical protein
MLNKSHHEFIEEVNEATREIPLEEKTRDALNVKGEVKV